MSDLNKKIEPTNNKLYYPNFCERILEQLKALDTRNGKIICFPIVFHRLGYIFKLRKKEIWVILSDLEKENKLKIIPHHGVILENEK